MKKDINSIFELYYTRNEFKKIRQSKIMIIGCGGLGSNIINMLVRSGFINLIIIDHDVLELKNLNRQLYYPKEVGQNKVESTKKRILDLNPKLKLTIIKDIINEKKLKKIIRKYNPDIIVEAVDKEWTKKMIFETTIKLNKQLITASGVAGYGDVENIKVIRRKKYTIIGDLVSRCGCCDECYQEKKGCNSPKKLIKEEKCHMPLAPKVTAVASMQADEVIRRILMNKKYKTNN